MNRSAFFQSLLDTSGDALALPAVPEQVNAHLPSARKAVAIAQSVAASGSHATYFEVSRERYAHYVAAAIAFLPVPARILDVGNAPGHVANLLHQLGHEIHGLNLNSEWRNTYPDQSWLKAFNVVECDIEATQLPYPPESFDAIVFTEVLEHIAITHPRSLLKEFRRVLRSGGIIIFSTPNVCNISNILALLAGKNVFWAPEIFYGSHDRHNREYTPEEVRALFADGGFREIAFWGMSDSSNWRTGAAEDAYAAVALFGESAALLRNTIVAVFSCDPRAGTSDDHTDEQVVKQGTNQNRSNANTFRQVKRRVRSFLRFLASPICHFLR